MSSQRLPSEFQQDAVFDVLAHEYRRAVLSYLRDRSERVSLEELAEHVAAAVAPAGNVRDGKPIERVVIQLYHVHLPKLEEKGFVTYDDADPHRVEATPAGRRLGDFLSGEPLPDAPEAESSHDVP